MLVYEVEASDVQFGSVMEGFTFNTSLGEAFPTPAATPFGRY